MQTQTSRLPVQATGGFPSLMTFVRRYLSEQQARMQERRSLAALRHLDDRLLRDVGLTRADVFEMTER
jgi:uncharacterized protein YjiS (DUF1127 family)